MFDTVGSKFHSEKEKTKEELVNRYRKAWVFYLCIVFVYIVLGRTKPSVKLIMIDDTFFKWCIIAIMSSWRTGSSESVMLIVIEMTDTHLRLQTTLEGEPFDSGLCNLAL